jgi:hypothetical protein
MTASAPIFGRLGVGEGPGVVQQLAQRFAREHREAVIADEELRLAVRERHR